MIYTDLVTVSSFNDDVALVQFQSDDAIDSPLAGGNGACDELSLRCEEVTVVQDATELDGDELVSERTDVPVEGETFQVDVCGAENGCSRGLVATARFDTNEPVFDDINASDAVLPGESVQGQENLYCICVFFLFIWYYDFDRQTL